MSTSGRPSPSRARESGRAYHHGDLRAALVRAGVALLAEGGDAALSLREVARRAGVSHNAPYRHFADKDALLAAIAAQGLLELARVTQDASARVPDDPIGQIVRTGWAYVKCGVDHPQHYGVMFTGIVGERERHTAMRAAEDRAYSVLVDIIASGQRAGVVRPGEPRQLAVVAWSLVHGLTQLLIERRLAAGPDGAEGLTRFCARALCEGLAVCASSATPRAASSP